MTKIYIIGHRNINTLEVGLAIQSKDDSITVAPRFTTNIDEVTEYKYFLDKETVNISYKNNAIITITTDDNESNGIIYDDYYNNDIFCMNLAEFNVMPDKLFDTDDENDILVVWVDSSLNVPRSDVNEVEYLEEIVIALACCELQSSDSLWVPSVLDTVLAVVELSHVWQEVEFLGLECLVVQADGITGDGLKSDTADSAHLCSEVALQEALAQTDALEDLGTTVTADGRDTHLSHNLEQALLHSLDIVLLGCMIILLNLSLLYEVVEDGVCQVWTEG